MLDQHLTHPKKDDLMAFGLGKLDPHEAGTIEKHLEECPDCCETLVDLKDDTFVDLVRQAPLADPLQPNSELTLDLTERTTTSKVSLGLPAELLKHGRYEIQERIGRGGMGDVYKAQHKLMNRVVALKVINRELVRNDSTVQRFQREVQAAARLHHRHIVTAYDAEQAGELHFLVMEFVAGTNLSDVVRQRGPLPVAEALDYIRQAATGLQHAHELGMVHRDIKPHNLMLATSGDIKILDFGLARFASELTPENVDFTGQSVALSGELTQMGSMMGTPDYIAPEQARDSHAADIRADIYSLGCTLYMLLAGRSPFDSGSVLDKIQAHTLQEPTPLAKTRGDVPAEVETVLRRMMAKDPDARYQTPAEVAAALALCEASLAATPETIEAGSGNHRRRNWTLAGAAGFLLAALAGILFYIQTDNGTVSVEVLDESLAVTLNGKTLEMKDGKTPLTIRTGDSKLVIRRGDFEFESNSFQLRRGDKITLKVELLAGTVVVKKDGEPFGQRALPFQPALNLGNWQLPEWFAQRGLPLMHALPATIAKIDPMEKVLSESGVEPADSGWKITADVARTFALFERPLPKLEAGLLTYRAKLKSENVKGRAYLHMLVRFPGKGEFFSKGVHQPISGTTDWSESEIVFQIPANEKPNLVKLNVEVEGTGSVWIKDIELRGPTTGGVSTYATVPPLAITLEKKLKGATTGISRVAYSKDGKYVLAAAGTKVLRWESVSGLLEGTYQLGKVPLEAIVPLADNTRIVTSSRQGEVRLWDLKNKTVIQEFTPHKGITAGLAISPDETLVLSGSDDRTVRLSDMEFGEELHQLDYAWCRSVGFSADGRQIVFGNQYHATVYDVDSWKLVRNYQVTKTASARTVDLSPDGRLLVTGTDSGGVMLWNLETGEAIHTARLEAPVRSCAFLPDSRHFVTGCEDQTLRLWSSTTGKQILQAKDSSHATNWIAVSPDGKTVASGGGISLTNPDLFKYEFDGDGDIRLWRLPESVWPQQGKNKSIVVTLNGAGRYLIDGRPVDDSVELLHRLKASYQEHPGREVVIDALKKDELVVKELIALAREVGFKSIRSPAWAAAATLDKLLAEATAVYTFEKETFQAESGGMFVRDVTGRGQRAVANGVTYNAEGLAGGALDCHGKDLRLDQSFIAGKKEYTIAMWVRDAGKAPDGKANRILMQESQPQDGGTFFPFHITLEGTRVWASAWQGQRWSQANSAWNVVPTNEWFFLAVTVMTQAQDRSVIRITVNDKTYLQPFNSLPVPAKPGYVRIGGITGSIDELCFFERALSEEEVTLIRNRGLEKLPLAKLLNPNSEEIRLVRQYPGHANVVRAVRIAPNGKQVISIGWDQTMRTTELDSGASVLTKLETKSSLENADISNDGQFAAALWPRSNMTYVWKVTAPSEIKEYQDYAHYPQQVLFSADGTKFLLTGTPGLALLKDTSNGQELKKFSLSEPKIPAAAMSLDGTLVALANGREAHVMSVNTGRRLHGFGLLSTTDACRLAISADNSLVAAAQDDGDITVQNLKSRDIPLLLDHNFIGQHSVSHLEFLGGNRFLLAALDSKMLRIWDLQTKELVAACNAPAGTIRRVALSPDGRLVVTGGGETWSPTNNRFVNARDNNLRTWQLPENVWPAVPIK